jgi:hypothetical protein
MDADKLIKALTDAIPEGEHPEPYAKWIQVRLDFVQAAIDTIDWLEKGLQEWRDLYKNTARQHSATQATARVAVGHLQAVLNKARTHAEQQAADTAARDWLISIGSEPN